MWWDSQPGDSFRYVAEKIVAMDASVDQQEAMTLAESVINAAGVSTTTDYKRERCSLSVQNRQKDLLGRL